MTIAKINNKITMTFTAREYIKYCKKCNEDGREQTDAYCIHELVYLEYDQIINEDMLDECDDGFYMWSHDFWSLYRDLVNVDPEDFEGEAEFNICE